MNQENIFTLTESLLSKDDFFCSSDGKLLRSAVLEAAEKMNPSLIEILIKNEKTKTAFFVDVNGTLVFDKVKFCRILQNKSFLPDSYTMYKNKIGLTDSNGNFISSRNDIELVFPHKDCILEGGQTKEEKGRKEIFYNETLAPEQITNLLAPKAFCNAKKYDEYGESVANEITEKDNLIIKGNNLLALSSLLERYAGKVKCIYIDPPYNTGNDEFNYNDNFNHSTWLLFMKNRLELAKKLLKEDGSIFIQCDDFEDAYLKVLMDEIFGSSNFRNKITWKRRGGSANPQNRLNNVTDYILWYSKSDQLYYTPIYTLDDEKTKEYIRERFTNVDENGRRFMKSPLQSPNPRPNLMYEYKGYKIPAKGWSISRDIMEKWDAEGRLCFPEDKNQNINRKIYLDEYQGQPISSLWTDIYVINPMSNEALDFTGQKPEVLINRIFNMCTKPNDLILDFHLGSGTTAAVAHKMNRQYIGVEQMDYINTVTVERLKKVIAGEQGGISKAQNWQGGGSFVYCELAKQNQLFVEQIQNCKTDEEITDVTNKILKSDFVSTKINPSAIDTSAKDYADLSFENKQRFAMEILDKNALYINAADIDDKTLPLTESDRAFTKNFYGKAK